MSEGTERVSVTTHVPDYQKEIWKEEAVELDMTQSEFVRSMVQAGRRAFNLEQTRSHSKTPVEGDVEDATPGVSVGEDLKDQILELLRRVGPLEASNITIELVSEDDRERIHDAIDSLDDTNRIEYQNRAGGYVVTDPDGE